MKNVIFLILFFSMLSEYCFSQIEHLEGPRIGVTILTNGTSSDRLNSNLLTQLGYQWETKFSSDSLGYAFLGEWVLLVGGLEKGYFIPSLSYLLGFRTIKGFEFAVGANLSLTGFGPIIAIGKSFKFGSVYVPVNLAFVPSIAKEDPVIGTEGRTGSRITFTFGFNSKY
jgi:hypothetical protein|tara:strand:+ start:311 stop:817 length:507 start_codon:yes stop_codon:yes gene_type:complete